MPKVAFSGMTAAGKTTHARILAEQLGYSYVSAIHIILDILGIADDPAGIWSRDPRLWEAFKDPGLNAETDRRLLELAESDEDIVFDAWALPWLSNARMLRVWLESDQPSRQRKHRVSQLQLGNPTADLNVVPDKDAASRRNFLETYGFDIEGDHSFFDLELDNTMLIPDASIATAAAGIATLAPIVLEAFKAWHAGDAFAARACQLHHGRYVKSFRFK